MDSAEPLPNNARPIETAGALLFDRQRRMRRWGRIGAHDQAQRHAFADRATADRDIATILRRRGTAETRIGVPLRAGAYRGLSRHRHVGCLELAGATASMLPAQAAHPLLDDSPDDHRPTVALRILAENGSAGQDAGGPLHVGRSPVSATAAMVMARSRRNGRSGKASRQIFSAIDASSCGVGGRASRMHAIKARGNRRSIVSLRLRYGSPIARMQP
ncbi:hypothetical protein FA702_21420 (plasmid) [Novosphingobium sp. EMRT-2]|nr:hypothetical protein FA702_21420 [Novosphingobium sp. EMRT-2]